MEIRTAETVASRGRPSLGAAVLVTCLTTLLVVYIRLCLYPDRLVPLPYGIALLVTLWHRNRALLWGSTALFSALISLELFRLEPEAPGDHYRWTACALMLVNTWVMAGVIRFLVTAQEHLVMRHAALEETNAALEAVNEELAASEEEIRTQNEELQSQAEELEQQAQELQEHGEQLEAQRDHLQTVNQELERRGKAVQTLLESACWLSGELGQREILERICGAALQVMEGAALGAAIVERSGDQLILRGYMGFGKEGPIKESWAFDRSFASLVMRQGRTACMMDTTLRPDLEVPQPANGKVFQSVLASPLRVEGKIIGAIKVYGDGRQEWMDEQFKIIEWLAAQSSIVLEALKLHRELEQRRQEAEEASIRKTRFLAAVSHDVRTPANAIGLLAELINRTANEPEFASEIPELARDLKHSAKALVELVSDVLDLARYDSGKLDLQHSEFALWPMVQAEVRQLSLLAEAKDLVLTAEPPDGDVWVRTDRMKLARVLKNVIGNAIKFTDAGQVSVRLWRSPAGGIQIAVSDTGVGISAEHLAHIFDEFFQLRNPERDRSKGTGLGLAICRRLVDAIGCELEVQSRPGEGSTFKLTVPPALVIQSSAATQADREGPTRRSERKLGLNGLCILLVEDHATTRRTTARLLSSEGADVAQAENGQAALDYLKTERPDAVLLDLMLPDMDGTDVLRAIRSSAEHTSARVFAISGDVTAGRAEELMHLGIDDIMPKPIDMQRLIAALATPAPSAKGVPEPSR